KEKYAELIEVFSKEGFVAKEEKEVKDEDIRDSSLLILSSESPVLKRLFGQISRPEVGFTLVVKQNPLNAQKVVAYVDSDSTEEVEPVAK
ncbi:MAG TPA: hypothetical protein VJZ24_04870, partial [Thermodesulfovibrionales bacterium]|nr:hypothetical protein [Thermodesulfovibrionales bacterium]